MLRKTLIAAAGSCLLAGCVTHATCVSPLSKLQPAAAPPRAEHFKHVLIIVLENQDYRDVVADPYFADLASRGATFHSFQALFHPSYPNYLAMVSGASIPTHGDRQVNVDYPTIGDSLKGDWANYAEGYPAGAGSCNLTSAKGKYVRRHVPFLSFVNVQHDSCRGIVPAERFAEDVRNGTLPSYAFYSPDLDHDGHDPVRDAPLGLEKAKCWLQGFLEPLLRDDKFTSDTLTILTFDESEGHNPSNQILTVFLGKMVKRGVAPGYYNHFNVLRTIEDNFGLPLLATGDREALPIEGIWTN